MPTRIPLLTMSSARKEAFQGCTYLYVCDVNIMHDAYSNSYGDVTWHQVAWLSIALLELDIRGDTSCSPVGRRQSCKRVRLRLA